MNDQPNESSKPSNGTPAAKKVPPEDLVALLKEAVTRRRPSKLAMFLFWFFPVALPLGLIAWWTWPRAEPMALAVTAFDSITVEGEPGGHYARLEPLDPAGSPPNLASLELFFEDGRAFPPPGQSGNYQKAATGKNHVAIIKGFLQGKEEVIPFAVRYLDPQHDPPPRDRGRLFVWSAKGNLLFVPLSSLVKPGDALEVEKIHPDAQVTLQKARGYGAKVVFVDDFAKRDGEYKRHRAALARASGDGKTGLPDGPLLLPLGKETTPLSKDASHDEIRKMGAAFSGIVLELSLNEEAMWHVVRVPRNAKSPPIPLGKGNDLWKELARYLDSTLKH